jgi:hypothetical protein
MKVFNVQQLRHDRRTWLVLALFGAYLLVILATFPNYGVTYDEDWHGQYGRAIIDWYTGGFLKGAAYPWEAIGLDLAYDRGGLFQALAAAAARLSPFGFYETSHLVNALFGFVAAVGAYKLGRFLGGFYVGLLAAALLIVTPRFYGHAFGNPSDIPFAAASVFAVYYLIRLVAALPHPSRSLVVKLGVAIGLALSLRIGGVLLVGYLGLALLVWLAIHFLVRPAGAAPVPGLRRTLLTLGGAFAAIGVVAAAVMVVWWPAIQTNPLTPIRAFLRASTFHYDLPVFFEGRTILNSELPWYYELKWFALVLPEFYFLALAAGLVAAGVWLWRRSRGREGFEAARVFGIGILLFSILFPIAYTALTRPVNYDEVRHFLFVFPLLAVLAALSLVKLLEVTRASWAGRSVLVAALVLALIAVFDMIELHPYQYIYFNRLVAGGVAEAARSYEADYWGSGLKEAVAWVEQNYETPADGTRPKVASCLYSTSTSYFLSEKRFEYVGTFHNGHEIDEGVTPDLFLATSRWDCDKKLAGKLIHTVTRRGVPLVSIIEVSPNAPGGTLAKN